MGWERKRGKIEEFNRLLRGASDTSFTVQVGELSLVVAALLALGAVLMILVGDGLRVGTVTGHIPLKDVAEAVTTEKIMSKARLLAASAHSTFSMWASYLGRMPTLYYPGKMDQSVFPPGSDAIEEEWEQGGSLPPAR